MIFEYIKRQPQNLNSINDLVNNDVLDSSLDNLERDPWGEISDKTDEIEDQEINTINNLNLKNENPLEIVKQKYQNKNKINDFESDGITYLGIFDEQQEKPQILEDEDIWKIKNTNQDNYRVFQKKSKKKTEYFD